MINVKLRHLAIALSKLPPNPCNSVELEQYQTEGNLAALWLSQIDGKDGLEGKTVLDLGAGNGILGHGAQLLGAEVTFVECDPCLLYTSPSPRDRQKSRMPSSA